MGYRLIQRAGQPVAAAPPPETVPERKGLFTTRNTSGNVSLGGYAGDALLGAYHSLTGLSGALEDTLSGAPVTSDMQQKAIEAAPLALGINPAVRSGGRAIEGMAQAMQRSRPPVPSAADLVEAGGAQLKRAKGMGVEYDPQAVSQLLGSIKQRLIREGFREKQTPATFDILSEIPPASAAGERVVTDLGDLHSTRMALGNAAKNFQNPQEQGTAARAIEILDEFIKAPPAASVVAGPATAAGEEFAQGIGNYAAGMRSARLDGFDEDSFVGVAKAADLRAAAANSGRNLDNAIRTRIASLLLNPKTRAGYSPEELKAIEAISTGNFGRNRVRDVGKYLGGGGGLGGIVAGATAGGAAGSFGARPGMGALIGAAAPTVGVGANTVANALTRRALGSAGELVRRRSPLYEEMQAAAPMEAAPTAGHEAALKAILFALQERSRHEGGGGY